MDWHDFTSPWPGRTKLASLRQKFDPCIIAEPFSLATGIVEPTHAGFALGKFLNDTWLSYKNAPAEVLEIAHEVTICCELMTPLGDQLKTGSISYTSKFQEAVERLVKNVS